MVRQPSFDRYGTKKGAWSEEEDNILRAYVQRFGHPNWRLLPSFAGLARCGKSCRLRWVNYLKPGVKRGNFSREEEDLIINLHARLGNKWSDISKKLPGRTDNDIKNYYHAHIKKRRGNSGRASAATINTNQEDQSSQINSCITTDDYQAEETVFNNVFAEDLYAEDSLNMSVVNPFTDAYLVAQAQGDPTYDHTFFSHVGIDLPPFPDEEFNDFGLYQNDLSTFSDSSDGGVTNSWNSSPVESHESFWYGSFEDTFDMVLWG